MGKSDGFLELDNYVTGFEPITTDNFTFDTVRVFVSIQKTITLLVYPWFEGEVFAEDFVPTTLYKQIQELVEQSLNITFGRKQKRYIETKGIKPVGEVFDLNEQELEGLFTEYVKGNLGIDVAFSVGCHEEDYDVYVQFGEDLTEECLEKLKTLGLHPEEHFLNRDALISQLFGDFTSVERICEETYLYRVLVPSSIHRG